MLNFIYTFISIACCLAFGYFCYYLLPVIPASLYGMMTLTVALSANLINAEKINTTMQWAIRNMGVCFLPAAVGIIEYVTLLEEFGLAITLIAIITTLILMAIVGFLYQHYLETKQ